MSKSFKDNPYRKIRIPVAKDDIIISGPKYKKRKNEKQVIDEGIDEWERIKEEEETTR